MDEEVGVGSSSNCSPAVSGVHNGTSGSAVAKVRSSKTILSNLTGSSTYSIQVTQEAVETEAINLPMVNAEEGDTSIQLLETIAEVQPSVGSVLSSVPLIIESVCSLESSDSLDSGDDDDEEDVDTGGIVWRSNQDETVTESPVIDLRCYVYSGRNLTGVGYYVQFYHAYQKHRTSKRDGSPVIKWNEWFPIKYTVGTDTPRLTIELWKTSLFCHKKYGSTQLDITRALDGGIIDDYFTFGSKPGQVRLKVAARGLTLSETLDATELSPEQANDIDRLKHMYPAACYLRIMEVYRSNDYSFEVSVQRLQRMGPSELYSAIKLQNFSLGLHLSPEERVECFSVIRDLMPDVTELEIEKALVESGFHVGRAIQHLIEWSRLCNRHRRGSLVQHREHQLLETQAHAGGFATEKCLKTGSIRLVHKSVLPEKHNLLEREQYRSRREMLDRAITKQLVSSRMY